LGTFFPPKAQAAVQLPRPDAATPFPLLLLLRNASYAP
jgi:hypothetical protein